MKSHPTEKFERMIDCIWKSVAIWAILSAGLSATAVGQEAFDFAHRVVPILQKRCSQCHTGNEKQGGFSLNTRESAMAGADSEKKILASPIEESELIRRVLSEDPDERMPPEGDRLTGEEVATLREWLASGAPWEPGFSFEVNRYSPPLKPRHPQLPPATEENRTHPIDRILDAYRAERKLPILPVVRDAVFVRRAYLDLIGLLPTPSEVQSYVQDQSADKRDRLVRELLNRDIDYAEH